MDPIDFQMALGDFPVGMIGIPDNNLVDFGMGLWHGQLTLLHLGALFQVKEGRQPLWY